MAMTSTDLLRLMVQRHLGVLVQKGFPEGPLKRDRLTIVYVEDGAPTMLPVDPYSGIPAVTADQLDDFLRQHYLAEVERDADAGTVLYGPTEDAHAAVQG